MYRLLAADVPEVESLVLAAENAPCGIVFLHRGTSCSHKINLNPKFTGRVKWIGVEERATRSKKARFWSVWKMMIRARIASHGAAENARAYYQELQHGSVPKNSASEHNLAEAREHWPTTRLVLIGTRN